MDVSLIIFIAVVAIFAFRGYRNGLLKSLSRILSLISGYVVAILYSKQLSLIVASNFQLEGLVAYILASILLFTGAAIAVGVLFRLIVKLRSDKRTVTRASSFGGVVAGGAVGIVVAFAIVWIFAFTRDLSPAGKLEASAASNKSMVEDMANRAASKAVNTAMTMVSAKPEVTSLSMALAANPVDISLQIRRLAGSDDLISLLNDRSNQAVLDSGNAAAVQKLPGFIRLARNRDLLALAKSAGLLNPSEDNAQAMETALARQLTDTWGRVQRVKNDRRVQEILSDPEFQQKIKSANPLDLLTNTRLLELADIVFSDTAGQVPDSESNANQPLANSPMRIPEKKETQIYRWVDKNGRVYFSDVEPGS